jgi:hypothetical protein
MPLPRLEVEMKREREEKGIDVYRKRVDILKLDKLERYLIGKLCVIKSKFL